MGDTHYSGSELVVRKLAEMGAVVKVHDPYVLRWWRLEKQGTYQALGYSRARFFRNQDDLVGLRGPQDLTGSFKGADAVVLAVRHGPVPGPGPRLGGGKVRRPGGSGGLFRHPG
ncbi:hypothetical protein DFAR_2130004 [Desulfarculales bacterium]